MGPIWVLSAPDGPHVGPMNLAICGYTVQICYDAGCPLRVRYLIYALHLQIMTAIPGVTRDGNSLLDWSWVRQFTYPRNNCWVPQCIAQSIVMSSSKRKQSECDTCLYVKISFWSSFIVIFNLLRHKIVHAVVTKCLCHSNPSIYWAETAHTVCSAFSTLFQSLNPSLWFPWDYLFCIGKSTQIAGRWQHNGIGVRESWTRVNSWNLMLSHHSRVNAGIMIALGL